MCLDGFFFLCTVDSVRSSSDITEVMTSGSISYVSWLSLKLPDWMASRKKHFLHIKVWEPVSKLIVEATTKYPAGAVQVYSRIYGRLHPLLLLKSLPLQHQLWSLGKMPHSVRILKAIKNVVKTRDVNDGDHAIRWLGRCLVDCRHWLVEISAVSLFDGWRRWPVWSPSQSACFFVSVAVQVAHLLGSQHPDTLVVTP